MAIVHTLQCVALCMTVVSGLQKEPRVIGGKVVSHGDFPYVVLVQRTDYKCTGTLVTSEWVLTAGHCTELNGPELYWVTAGIVYVFESGNYRQERNARLVVRHPKYSHTYREDGQDVVFYDIAIIKVVYPFVLNKYVNSVALSTEQAPYWGEPCVGVGFGLTSVSNDILQLLKPPATSDSRAMQKAGAALHKLTFSVTPIPCKQFGDSRWQEAYQLCTMGGEVNQTHLYLGDSGGPLICRGLPVGIFSILEGKWFNGKVFIVHVHTSLFDFILWLKGYIPEIKFQRDYWPWISFDN